MSKSSKVKALPVLGVEEIFLLLYALDPVLATKYYQTKFDRRAAFTVAYLETERQVAAVLESLADATASGATFEEWKAEIQDSGLTLKDGHLKTVWRTNIFDAFNGARYEQFREDEEEFPFLMFEAVDSPTTRPNHKANDGLVMRANDPRWEGRTPMLGFNCRCILLNLTAEEAKTRGTTRSPRPNSLADDAGWGARRYNADVKHYTASHFAVAIADTPPEFHRAVALWIQGAAARLLQRCTEAVAADYDRRFSESFADTQRRLNIVADAQTATALPSILAYVRRQASGWVETLPRFVKRGEGMGLLDKQELWLLRNAVRSLPPSLEPGYTVARDTKAVDYSQSAYATRTTRERFAGFKQGQVLRFNGLQSFTLGAGPIPWADVRTEFVLVDRFNLKNIERLSSRPKDQECLAWSPVYEVAGVATLEHVQRVYLRTSQAVPTAPAFAPVDYSTPFGDFAVRGGTFTLDTYLDLFEQGQV
jgi:SPP1 gp7 family putative phage head morphogenesis protein